VLMPSAGLAIASPRSRSAGLRRDSSMVFAEAKLSKVTDRLMPIEEPQNQEFR